MAEHFVQNFAIFRTPTKKNTEELLIQSLSLILQDHNGIEPAFLSLLDELLRLDPLSIFLQISKLSTSFRTMLKSCFWWRSTISMVLGNPLRRERHGLPTAPH